ncbi:hypothetical protein [Streptomyces sp. NPDC059906]|uniref:hypothetical protein n=1 Tax=Streptomyces sp. NPDC059906 TaxID=3346997 RepID=UPI0036597D48
MNRNRRFALRHGAVAALVLFLVSLPAAAGHGPGEIVEHLTGTTADHSGVVAEDPTDTAWGA